ncbi:MAG: cyclic nucleotide-binding domain-containing protein, partial [Pseudomonadota bacterium]
MENIQDVIASLSPAGRALLDAQTTQVQLDAGETLFLAGAQGLEFFLLQSGSLGAFAGAPPELRLLGTISPGETVGEMAIIAGAPRSATVIALRDCELLRMTAGGLNFLLTEHPAFAA